MPWPLKAIKMMVLGSPNEALMPLLSKMLGGSAVHFNKRLAMSASKARELPVEQSFAAQMLEKELAPLARSTCCPAENSKIGRGVKCMLHNLIEDVQLDFLNVYLPQDHVQSDSPCRYLA